LNRVGVDLDAVGAVFEFVVVSDGFGGSLPFLRIGMKPLFSA